MRGKAASHDASWIGLRLVYPMKVRRGAYRLISPEEASAKIVSVDSPQGRNRYSKNSEAK
ncbi:hypothetical protein LX32DRAFT_644443 [Colletotrichum zoysiae]|uniref:Uncharacterized protein n=1 Tax=Colletotrichum zoysiae TaxID=1216348 RepID=A0AAD9H8L7_9PEZI|nr:hypothetical protein LX32DRAFT_644443 [Colletotrichum zoysiae]